MVIVSQINPLTGALDLTSETSYIRETYIDKVEIRSPTISGNEGFFLNLFTVGIDGIIIDGENKTIRSSNYIAGTSGWQINNDGNAEFQDGIFRGDINATSGIFSGTVLIGTDGIIMDGINKTISSSNYITGVSGWNINNDGDVEFQSGEFRGIINAIGGIFSGGVVIGVDGITLNGEDKSIYSANYNLTNKTGFKFKEDGTFLLGKDTSNFFQFDGTNFVFEGIMVAGDGSSIAFDDITGATKPDDNATLGATWGTDIGGTNLPDDNATLGATWGLDIGGINLPADNATVGATRGVDILGSDLPDNNATVGASWGVNLTNIPNSAIAPYITLTKITTTNIESPAISGNDGYFSNTFKVGSAGIVIDGVNKVIRSDNYVSGSSGWIVYNNGNSEFNGGIYRGSLHIGNTTDFIKMELDGAIPKIILEDDYSAGAGGQIYYDDDTNNSLLRIENQISTLNDKMQLFTGGEGITIENGITYREVNIAIGGTALNINGELSKIEANQNIDLATGKKLTTYGPAADGAISYNGDYWYYVDLDGTHKLEPGSGGGETDHGLLTGLADNDHPQYSLTSHTHTGYLATTGGTMSGAINMGTSSITNIGTLEVNNGIVPDNNQSADIGTSTLGFNDLYIDEIYCSDTGAIGIRDDIQMNSNDILNINATYQWECNPNSNLGGDLGTPSVTWGGAYIKNLYGYSTNPLYLHSSIDMNSNDISEVGTLTVEGTMIIPYA